MFKFLFLLTTFITFSFAQKPNLLLLKSYKDEMNVSGWLMSEKLDGIRAYWSGSQLLSRSGRVIASPKWFTADFPPFEIDGELWTKRGDFEEIVSIVNRSVAHDGWHKISYNIFEVPHHKGGLLERLNILKRWLQRYPNPYLKIIPQKNCRGSEDLKKSLASVVNKGGEGLVLRDPQAPYIDRRTSSALKVKQFTDDECIITGYTDGRGKFKGLVGALICQWHERSLKIGSGLSLEERKKPPTIGTEITFKYTGFTKYGKPKYPVFLRVRSLK
jgi:DNA ligase-1